MKRKRFAAAIVAALVFLSVPADAHSLLDRAEPAVGSTVSAAPQVVRIWFSSAIAPASAKIMVMDTAGKRVDEGNSKVVPEAPNILTVGVKPLCPGLTPCIGR